MEIFKIGINDGQYDGSRRFVWLADFCGLSVDLVSIIIIQQLLPISLHACRNVNILFLII